jgi:site-specific DNA-methyltransferase (adenine-specific)
MRNILVYNVSMIEKRLRKLDYLYSPSNQEVYTPLKLVDEILDKLPAEVWDRKDYKWLNPAVKNGVWLGAVTIRLVKNYLFKGIFNTEEEALSYVLDNQIYGYTLSKGALRTVNRVLYNNIDYIGNIEFKNVLEENIDMKFDPSKTIVVTNPPFNPPSNGDDKIKSRPIFHDHVAFVKEKINPKYYAAVIPSRWISTDHFEKFRDKMISSYNMKYIKFYDTSQEIFGKEAAIDGGVCYFITDNNYNEDEIEIEHYGTRHSHSYKDYGVIPIVDTHIPLDIVDKIINSGCDFMNTIYKNAQNIRSNHKTLEGEAFENSTKVYGSYNKVSYISNNEITTNNLKDKYKVSFATTNGSWRTNNTLVNLRIIPKGEATTMSLAFFYFDEEEHAKNCFDYLNTKFARLMIKLKQFNKNYTSGIFTWLPLLDFSKSWTDEELYKYFNLTQEEIDYIETNVK